MSATVPRQNQESTADPLSRAVVDGRHDSVVTSYERSDDVVVLEPLGRLDRAGIEQLRDAARAFTGRPIAIDLRDCVVTEPNALAELTDDDDGPFELCFISRRLTCRRLLARTGITARFAVFDKLEDALQARTFAHAGYGRGWRSQ